jgi:hypothetical protein
MNRDRAIMTDEQVLTLAIQRWMHYHQEQPSRPHSTVFLNSVKLRNARGHKLVQFFFRLRRDGTFVWVKKTKKGKKLFITHDVEMGAAPARKHQVKAGCITPAEARLLLGIPHDDECYEVSP